MNSLNGDSRHGINLGFCYCYAAVAVTRRNINSGLRSKKKTDIERESVICGASLGRSCRKWYDIFYVHCEIIIIYHVDFSLTVLNVCVGCTCAKMLRTQEASQWYTNKNNERIM